MPSLRQLEYLLAIQDERHFRRAAAKMGISQPTLSAQLSTLEQALGAQLVERSRSRVLLTPVGKEVAEIARRIVRDVQEIRDVATHKLGEPGGTIRLGLPPTIGPYLLPRVIPRIHRAYPHLKLYVREDVPRNLPDGLDQGKYDVVIMPVPVRAQGLESISLFREPLYLVVPADSDLSQRDYIERKDLKGRSILTLESGHHLREQVEALCEEFGAELLTDYEGTSLDTVRQMVGMGMGLSFLPGLYVHSTLGRDGSVKLVELKGRSLYRTIGLLWRDTSARKPEFEQLAQHIRDTVRKSFSRFPILSG
ncbi:MAG: hydrogen peroxide-inducible genes activator [Alphaproteobacteria bacterium]|nr:hydrogen peroxide-inducible genes activator [Alphaproteobacteria bacterium]